MGKLHWDKKNTETLKVYLKSITIWEYCIGMKKLQKC